MLVVELIIVLLAIFLGARLGGIGIGFAGGLGVLVLVPLLALNPVTSRSMSFPLSWRLSPLFLPCRLLAVWTIWFIRQKSCCAVTRNTSRSSHRS
ncbi:hypothetical protein D5Z32_11680 [Escherichia coli]|nr:hypothetical protein [Escherichia coli]